MHVGLVVLVAAFASSIGAGCGPKAPKEILEAPPDYPAVLGARKLYHTPLAYIYARFDADAGDADRWLRDMQKYIRDKYDGELDKGIVVVMSPEDVPLATTLEDQMAIERDPSLMVTRPRNPKSVEDVRKRMREEGIPEAAMVRASPLPLSREELRKLGFANQSAPWAVAAPSHALAEQSGVEVGIAALRKKRPDISEEQARSVVRRMASSFAKPFEMVRPIPVFILWAQGRKDWSDDQRREAIREQIKHLYRSNWMPVPSDEELQW